MPTEITAEQTKRPLQETRAAARRSRRRRGKIGILGSRKMPAPSWDQEAGCDDDQILRNEANVEFVSGPLSVVGGPLSVDVCTVEAVDEPSATNEPTAVQEIATNQATEDPENAANEATESGPDPGGSRETGTGAPPGPICNGGDAGGADREPDPAALAEIERVAACNRLGDEIARRAMIKAENVRKLDQQWWRDAEAAEAACRARQRGR